MQYTTSSERFGDGYGGDGDDGEDVKEDGEDGGEDNGGDEEDNGATMVRMMVRMWEDGVDGCEDDDKTNMAL